MSKKILFMSSAKLTAISIGLLLAVFCTIGMSFTPAEEGEILDPNDSTTVVSRPRRAHDPGTAGCGTKKTNDYGNAIAVSKGGGTVTIANVSGGGSIDAVYKGTTSSWGSSTGTTLPVTSNATANSGVKVVWVCGETDKTSGTAANHKHKFKWTATPSTGYKFDGWSTDGTNIDASITQSYDYEMEMDATQYNGGDGYSSSNPLAYTLYAHFSEKVLTTITMPATEHGSYTYSCADGSGTINTSTSGTVTTKEEITFTATPASGYKFFGWYTLSGTTENYLSFSNPYTKGFSANTTIYAKFIPSADAAYTLKGTSRYFTDLSSAISVASSSSNKVIVPVINGTVPAGNYTIPSGVTLLIPFDADYTLTTKPTDVQSWVNLSEYRRLKLANGTNITVNGTLCVAGRQFGTSSSNPGPGSVLGAYGVLDMSAGGHVAIASGANFYAYGFVIGNGNQSTSGTITIQNGGNVYEDLVINDLHGGGGTAACVNGTSATNSYELFPFNQYFVQNVEPKMTIEYGGSETVYFDIQSGQGGKQDAAKLIGNTTSHLFQLFSGASVTKWYDATRDYQCYSIEGAMTMNGISVNAVVTTLSSTSFILPVNNNMEITVKDGATLNLPYSIKFQTGANLIIEEDAVVNVGKDLYFYDYQDWDKFSCGYAQTFGLTSSGKKLSWHTLRTVSSASALGHANLVVNGTLNINSNNGALYTTSHGGNITSTGSGKIVFNVEAKSTNKNLYEIWSTYGKKSDGTALKQGETDYYTGQVLVGDYSFGKDYYIYGTPVACTPAQLHNADGSYTATAGSTAGTVFTYCCGTWLKQNGCGEPYYVTWKNGSTTIDTESFYACEDPVYTGATPTKDDDASYCHYTFDGWSATDGGDVLSTPLPRTTATYYAHFTSEPTVASVTVGSTTTYYSTFAAAFNYAKTQTTATVTILKDNSGTSSALTYNKASGTCTLDLNGKTTTLSVTASGNSANLFAINAANSTFTITDNSANKDGVLDITTSIKNDKIGNATRGIAVVDGSLVLNAGNIRLSNTYAYTSTSNSGMIKGINVAAGKTFTMNGGSVYVESPYYPRAINIDGSASANATVNINGGTITANATTTTSAMGIYTIGGTLNVKPGAIINATTKTESAYGIYVDTSTSGYFGTLNMTGGTINATATTKTAIGVNVNGVYVSKNTTPNTFGANYKAEANIYGGEFNVTTLGTTTAYGIQSLGTTIISGGTFTVAPKTSTAIGVYVLDGTTTIEGSPIFDVKATTIAYGIQAGAQPVEKTGRPYNGEVVVKGGTFNVATTSKTTAYGVYVRAATRNTENTASGYYPGHYASAGKATIEGGEFTVTSKTTTAYGILVERATPLYDGEGEMDAYAQGEATVKGGKFTVVGTTTSSSTPTTDGIRTYGDVTLSGGEFDVTASGGYGAGLRIFNGTTTVSGSPEFTVKATTYSYGAVVTGVAPVAATGFNSNAELIINNGTFDVSTTNTTYAYGVLVSPIAPVATEDPDVFYKSPSTLTINDGQFTVTAKTTIAQGVNCSRGYLMAGTTPNVLKAENLGVATINGGTFDVTTLGTTTAQGITNSGNTTVSGGTFNVTPKTTTAYGARCYHGLLTINDGAEFNVKATETAYGIVAGNEQPTTKGLLYDAEVEINGGQINVETTSKATIYGLWASGNSRTIATGTDYEGNYASAGKITVNSGTIKVKAKTNPAYGVVVSKVVSQPTNTDYPTATATPQAFINGGKFFVTATSSKNYAASSTPLAENCQITGGYYNTHTTQTSGTYLDKYVVSPKKKLALRSTHALYPDGYRYTVGLGGTVTWKNGETTLLTEDYLQGETPSYTGTTPTKAEDESYTYTHNSWDPAIAEMANADQTYTATFNHTEKKYAVNVAAGEGGSVSPTSVSGIGCVTASGDITATPNTGYQFSNWTLPAGVTAAAGYTANSNPIRINATASGKTITANFTAKTYTVTLNNQSATTAGATSVTATYNAAMPSIAANLPAKTGYAFGGYFSETNGGGTQYYNADGTSAHIWDVDAASPTLYAKWTSSVVETGPVLDIVDATNDGANGTLTLNATSWPNSAAGYYINEVLYTRSGNRTIVINYTGKEPGESFEIDVKKSGAAVSYSCHSYTIPRVITSNTAITEDQNWPIFVKGGATLTVDNNITTGKIYVGADAKLVINATLTAEGIYLRTTPTAAAEMLNNGSIDAQLYYTRIIDSKANYYPFGLPLDCDIEDVAMSDGSARPKYGSGWLLRWYDESSRAANGGATNNMTSKEGDPAVFPTKIVGGRGYEMFSASNYYREFYFPIDHSKLKSTVPVSYTADGAAGEKHAGWNVLVSPWTWTHNQISQPENITVCWLEGNTWGEQDNPDVIPPSKLFAYQASSGQSIVSFTGTNIAAARRRVTAAEEPTRIQWIRLDVKDVNGEGDQTSIYSHPMRYEQTYKTGIDVAKQALTSTHAILYSSHAYGDMAFAGVADSLLEAGVALTVYSPSAQELTISLRENDWLNRMEYVWLIDVETGMQINLLNSDYTFDAAEGTTRGRFFIRGQFKAPNITTDIQNGAGIEEGARKVLIDQKIYIEVNGRLYDATGKIVSK